MKEWDDKRNVMLNYDYLAETYDAQYAEEQNEKIKTALCNADLREDDLVLDIGCGTGLLFKHIDGSIQLLVGLDVSLRVLKKAKKYSKQYTEINLIRADADFIPFQNRVFDCILAITLLQNMPNPLLTLQEMIRVSKYCSTILVTGLKKKFSKNSFIHLINKAGLKTYKMVSNDKLKGYIATIKNFKPKDTPQ